MRILLVEDEASIYNPLKTILQSQGMAVDICADGAAGLMESKVNTYDCILLDINLPKLSGDAVLAKIRDASENNPNQQTPVLMLTAATAQTTKYQTFNYGADDYLTKPFDSKELILRINALVKRNSINKNVVLTCGNIQLNPLSKHVQINNQPISLTLKEFGVLEYLMRNQGRVVSSEELLEHVWDNTTDLFSDTVRTHIKTLRKQVDPKREIIVTVNGAGYIIN